MSKKNFLCVLFALAFAFTSMPAFAAQTHAIVDDSVVATPSKDNAYVILGDPVESNKMSFIDGLLNENIQQTDPTYSEKFEQDGIKGRKVYKQNYAYFTLDKQNYDFSGSKYLVLITYYDFGPDRGYFHFEYNSTSSKNKRISVEKPGTVAKWSTAKIIIDDAAFCGAMENGADMRIASGLYNAFSKIEIINLDQTQNFQSIATAVNYDKQQNLEKLGLYSRKKDKTQNYPLTATMTRIQVLDSVLKAVGCESEIDSAQPNTEFVDISGKDAKIVGVARKYNLAAMPEDKKFDPQKVCTVREMLTFYLRYMGYGSPELYNTAFEVANKNGLIKETDLIFGADRPITRDNFVAIAYNGLNSSFKRGEQQTILVDSLLKKGVLKHADTTPLGLASYKLYIAGDSIAAKYSEASEIVGWGMIIPSHFKKDVLVVNYAQSGASTKTFSNINSITKDLNQNDYVIIQFGHNDSASNSRGVDQATYAANLTSFIQKIISKGATPIVATSICRYMYNEGTLEYNIESDRIMSYRNVAKQVAEQNDVAFIDVAKLMIQKTKDLSKSQLDKMYVDEGNNNRVHLSQTGAEFVASIIADAIDSTTSLARLSAYLK